MRSETTETVADHLEKAAEYRRRGAEPGGRLREFCEGMAGFHEKMALVAPASPRPTLTLIEGGHDGASAEPPGMTTVNAAEPYWLDRLQLLAAQVSERRRLRLLQESGSSPKLVLTVMQGGRDGS